MILDEIHAVAQTKRGAHMALTLERLELAADGPVQRIGLSATQNPLEEVGRFMVGPKRTCRVVDAGVRKPLDLKIHVPVESMVEPEQSDAELDPFAGAEATRKSIWPAIYPEILELVRAAHARRSCSSTTAAAPSGSRCGSTSSPPTRTPTAPPSRSPARTTARWRARSGS